MRIDRWASGVEAMASIAFMTRLSRTCCNCTESPCAEESAAFQIKPDVDIAADQFAVQQADSRSDKVIDIDVFRFPLALLQKAAETVDNLAGPIVFMNNLLESIANFGDIRRLLRQ